MFFQISEKQENLDEEIEVIRKNQMGITELKNTIAEIRNLLAGIIKMTEVRKGELEDRSRVHSI